MHTVRHTFKELDDLSKQAEVRSPEDTEPHIFTLFYIFSFSLPQAGEAHGNVGYSHHRGIQEKKNVEHFSDKSIRQCY